MFPQQQILVLSKDDFTTLIDASLRKFLGSDNPSYYSQNTEQTVRLYTRNEVAILLKKSPNTITKYIRQKKLSASILNGVYFISHKEIEKFLHTKL